MSGLFKCVCTSFRWVPMSPTAYTMVTPVCHGPMKFAWTVIKEGQ